MQKEKDDITKTRGRDPIPDSFESISEAADFWDEHDSSEYEDLMTDAQFEVDIKRRVFFVPVAETVFGALREKAKAQGLSTETMLNLLLQKQLQ